MRVLTCMYMCAAACEGALADVAHRVAGDPAVPCMALPRAAARADGLEAVRVPPTLQQVRPALLRPVQQDLKLLQQQHNATSLKVNQKTITGLIRSHPCWVHCDSYDS